MKIKPTKIIGLQVADFDNLVHSGEEIHLRPARLLIILSLLTKIIKR